MTGLRTATQAPRNGRMARRISGLRLNSLAIMLMLLIEYGIGMSVNLDTTVPKADQGIGIGKAFGRALSNPPAALAVHAAFGLLLVVAGIFVLVRAFLARHPLVIVTSVIGLLAILAAGLSGSSFVNTGRDSSSMTMALAAGVAMLCYLINLWVVPSSRR
jgi:hypothetical protein